MVDPDTVQLFVSVDGRFRADRHARGILTVLAAHGDVKAFVIPFDDMNAG
jgi:hypothetical protein